MVSVGEDRNETPFPEPVFPQFFPESLLLPVMLFLTLASEPADLSSVGSDFLVKLLQALSFRLKAQDPSLILLLSSCFQLCSLKCLGWPRLSLPNLSQTATNF